MDAISESAGKQAFLVLAHEVSSVFTTLIQMLDHPKNDIFIHMDAKNKSYDPAETLKLVKHSRVFHTKRIKVSWGGYSQIEAELILLEAASQGHYKHYHLLSGADLPIKKQEDIISFFESHHAVEFVNFDNRSIDWSPRWRYYYPFQEIKGREWEGHLFIRIVNKILSSLQRLLHIHRNKGINIKKGGNWFSITDKFAHYILANMEWIRKVYHDTLCCDESFIQTLAINSEFKDGLYHEEVDADVPKEAMRLIDWKRGGPYVFRMSDLEVIKNSDAMFARKFSDSVDADIVKEIKKLYS